MLNALQLPTRTALWACVLMLGALLAPSPLPAQAGPAPVHPPRAYTVGVLDDNPPFSFRDADGVIRGYAVDLLAAIEEAQQLTLERRVGSTAEINGAFERGELDMLQSYVPNPERLAYASFTVPYLRMNGMIFVRRSEQAISRLEDLRGRRVLVHRRSTGERILAENGLQASIVTVGSVEESFRLLASGAGDATLASRLTGETMIRQLGLRDIVAVGEPVPGYSVNYCFAIRTGLDPLLASLEEGLALLDRAERGGISPKQRIYDRWFGFVDPRFSTAEIAAAISVGLGLALVVAVWALLRQRRLRAQIARQARQLQASEERYRTVFASTLHGLIVLERSAMRPGLWTVVEVNEAARRILGPPAPAPGEATLAEAFPADRSLAEQVLAQLEAERPAPFEHQRTAAEGAAWIDVAVSRLGRHGRLVAVRDISEARRAQEKLQETEMQLRQNQKLEAIGTLASGIAHDLNNVLAPIMMSVNLLQETLTDDKNVRLLETLRSSVQRGAEMVKQILSFTRGREGGRALISLKHLVSEISKITQETFPKNISIKTCVARDLWTTEADATQIHQVLMNLCVNARDAMPGGGALNVEARNVALDAGAPELPPEAQPGRYVMLSVSDSGSGIPPEIMEKIWEPFFTLKPDGKGTGLGLSTVQSIAKNHGGWVRADSELKKGSRFRVYLPAAAAAEPPPSPDAESALPAGHGEKILIIDDERAFQEITRAIFTKFGYRVLTASDGTEAVALFAQHRNDIDLVLTDMVMPFLDGPSTINALRRLDPNVRILASSGMSENDLQAEKLTGHPLLLKPFSTEQLLTTVDRVLKSKPAVSF